jgi:hypothetical protein
MHLPVTARPSCALEGLYAVGQMLNLFSGITSIKIKDSFIAHQKQRIKKILVPDLINIYVE